MEGKMNQLSVQTKLYSLFKFALLRSKKKYKPLGLLSMNKCVAFLQFLNKGSSAMLKVKS
jgi:hypothetical protein